MAKPETFPKGPRAAMGVRGPPGEDPGRSFAAAENMEAVARADGGGPSTDGGAIQRNQHGETPRP